LEKQDKDVSVCAQFWLWPQIRDYSKWTVHIGYLRSGFRVRNDYHPRDQRQDQSLAANSDDTPGLWGAEKTLREEFSKGCAPKLR